MLSVQIAIVNSDSAQELRQTLEGEGLFAQFRTCAEMESVSNAPEKDRPDLIIWGIRNAADLSRLQSFHSCNPFHPPIVALAHHGLAPQTFVPLLGTSIHDLLFSDELSRIGRVVHRILNIQKESPQTKSACLPSLVADAAAILLSSCPLAVFVLDREGLVQLWAGAAQEIFGWTSQEVIGKRLPTIPGGAEKEFQLLLEAQMQGISVGKQEVVRRRKDGALIHMYLWTAPFRDKEGHIRGELAMMSDITEQKRLLSGRPLSISHELVDGHSEFGRFRELLDAAPDGIIEVNDSGRIVLANASAEQMFGYSREELRSLTVDDLIPDHSRGQHVEHRSNYVRNPHSRPMGTGLQLFAKRKTGSEFPVEISLTPIRNPEGLRVFAIVRDVSERKKQEEQLSSIRTRFTEELSKANRELELRHREIARANQLKDEFLASISHELRTPLHTIVGFSELLAEEKDGELTPKQKRFVGHIQNDSHHLLALINDLLDLSAIEAGKLSLHPEPFEANEAIREVLDSLAELASSKSIGLAQSSPEAIQLYADRLRFKQVLYNLLSNAIKFTDAGGRVSISGSVSDSQAEFVVSDTGIGIAEHEQKAIFDKFYQLGSTTKGVREGTGLGLSVTRQLIERQGGTIWVISQVGVGSHFHFTLPLA